MRSRSSGHVAVGGVSGLVGAVSLVAGFFRPALLEGALMGTPLWTLAITCGLVLTITGGMILLFTMQKREEPQPQVLAHVAFAQRMVAPSIVPRPVPAPPRQAPAPSAARLPQPSSVAQQRVAPPRNDLTSLDAQIRGLTRQINKAGVMLATGQLSQGGYLAYVEDLKKQRGSLEAQRVRAELKS